MRCPRRTPRAFVQRAVKMARSRPTRVISAGEVAYAVCRSTEASKLCWDVVDALSLSPRFKQVYQGNRFSNVYLFQLKESSNV